MTKKTEPNVAKPKPRRIALKILAVVGAALAVGLVALLVYANVPNVAQDLPEAVSAEARERNTLIATSLVVGGIDEAFVDVTPERVFVSYETPDAANATAEDARVLQEFALGAAAQGAPSSARAVIVRNVDGVPALTWEVETAKVTAFLAGEMTQEDLLAAIRATPGEAA